MLLLSRDPYSLGSKDDLLIAIEENDAEAIELVFEEEDVDIDGFDDDGYTPLCRAALQGFSECIEALLLCEAQVNKNMRGPPGLSPLMCAASKGHEEAVEMLLENEADASVCFALRSHGPPSTYQPWRDRRLQPAHIGYS